MDIFSSHSAVEYYFRKFYKNKCMLFGGAVPSSLAEIPFNPRSTKDVLDNAVFGCTLAGDFNYGVSPQEYNTLTFEPPITTDVSRNIDFQTIGLVPFVYYGNVVPFRTYSDPARGLTVYKDLESQENVSNLEPLNNEGLIKNRTVDIHEAYWQYFDLEQEQDFKGFTLSQGYVVSYPYLQVEYYNETQQQWLSILDPEDEVSTDYTVWLSSDSSDLGQRAGYRLTKRNYGPYKPPYKYGELFIVQLDTTLRTRKIRMRNGNYPEPRDPNKLTRAVPHHFVTMLVEDEPITKPEIVTPTWGIMYAEHNGTIGDREYGNDFVVFSVGTEASSDVVLAEATFDAHTVDPKDLFGQTTIKLNQLV